MRDVAAKDLRGFDAVIHLAALSNDPLADLDPTLTHEINHKATVRLAKLAKAAGVQRFLFSSSCSTYGAGGDDLLTEAAEFHPVTPYGRSKVQSEQELALLADENFSLTYLRNATAYGFSPRLRLDLAVNEFVIRALLDRRIVLRSDGSAWRPLIHVEDICRAFIAILESPIASIHNRAFNIGRTADNYQIRDVATIVAQAVPGTTCEFAPGVGADQRCYRVSCEAIVKVIPEFRPRWDLKQGVRDLVERFEAVGIPDGILSDDRFIRLKRLRYHLQQGDLTADLRRSDSANNLPCSVPQHQAAESE